MSALPPKADMCGALGHVRFVPIADSCTAANGLHRQRCAGQSWQSSLRRIRGHRHRHRDLDAGLLQHRDNGLDVRGVTMHGSGRAERSETA